MSVALRQLLNEKLTDKEAAAEVQSLISRYYASRNDAPIWVTEAGPTEKAHALAAAIADGAAYGLDPKMIPTPDLGPVARGSDGADAAAASPQKPEELSAIELSLTLAALVYAQHARGGRIPDPAQMLNSNLDRKPQMHQPEAVIKLLVEADDVAAALVRLHPVHPQFEKLRQAFLQESGGNGKGELSEKAKRLRVNMEFWRWMWDDLGELHVFNNIPEFMQYVVRKGEVIRKERIVVGQINKQSSVFSRPLKDVVLRPRWRVPESIMVHELWPSLRKGGGLMRTYGLEITTKDGEPRDWQQIDWTKDDIRKYLVWQPPGRKSVLGFVKFSFPSQHTIFMHDTPDKWMFNSHRRTLSHGCLRVKNPMELAEIVLAYDRGWDRNKIKQLATSGPLDNTIEMSKPIPIHLAYFTAWVDDDGKVRLFDDIYGHERRVRQALDGDWKRINKGRNHLLKPQPNFSRETVAESFGGGRAESGAARPVSSAMRRSSSSTSGKSASSTTGKARPTQKSSSFTDFISGALGF